MKKSYGIGDQPFQPSRTKIHEYSLTAVPAAGNPLSSAGYSGPSIGFNVANWHGVLLSVGSPTYQANWQAVIRVWRYKQRSNMDWGPSGFWYAREQLNISMDGNVAAAGGGPMEFRLPTLQSEKMYFELISVTNAPATWEIVLGAYGLIPRVNPNNGEDFWEGAGGGGGDDLGLGACACAAQYVTEELIEINPFAGGPFTYYVAMDGYEHWSVQLVIEKQSGVIDTFTLGCSASLELGGDPTAFAALDWSPINDVMFNTASPATLLTNGVGPISQFYFGDTHLSMRYLRFVLTRTVTAGDDTYVALRIKKWW